MSTPTTGDLLDTRDNDPKQPTEPNGPKQPPEPNESQQPPQEPTAEGPPPEAPTEPLPPEQPPLRRLTRSRQDRVIGGVCGGLGRYFGIDPIIVRILAVGSVFLGGAGLLLYVAALLLVPSDPVSGPVAGSAPAAAAPGAAPEGRNGTLIVVGVIVLLFFSWPLLLGGGLILAGIVVPFAILVLAGLFVWWLVSGEGAGGSGGDIARRAALGVGILLLLMLLSGGVAWAAATGDGGPVMAGLVVAAGVALVAGAFLGGARWLILPALAVALPVAFVTAADVTIDGGVGERQYRPGSVTEVRDRYELGIGQLTVDLRDVDLPAGDTPLELDLGVGEAVVLVRDDVCVATRAGVAMGAVDVFDRSSGGIDVDWDSSPQPPAGTSRLVVDADLGIGHLDVRSRDLPESGDRRFRDRGFGPSGDRDRDGDEDTDLGNAACASGSSALGGDDAPRG